MPKTFRVDEGQIVLKRLPNGGLTFDVIDGVESVAQRLGILLQTRRGEDPLHPDIGLPMSVVGNASSTHVQGDFIGTLKQDAAVQTVDEVLLEPRNPRTRRRVVRIRMTLSSGAVIGLETEA